MITVTLVPVLEDNYSYILTADNGQCAVVDPGDGEELVRVLKRKNLIADYIFNTHHHGDHIAGNHAVKSLCKCKLIGPEAEIKRIAGIDIPVNGQSTLKFGGEEVQVIETPGHTSGHICFYFPESKILLSGDTLFSMGCGRLFEGSAEDMYTSLQKLKSLPGDTRIYCGHEYTLTNAQFCRHAAPDNQAIANKLKEVKKIRDNGAPTIPSFMEEEMKTNVFLMARSVEEFASLRRQKDNF